MSRRMLNTITAIAALMGASPVLAEESAKNAEPQEVPPCCERMAKQVPEHQERLDQAAEAKKETQQQGIPPPAEDSYAFKGWGNGLPLEDGGN